MANRFERVTALTEDYPEHKFDNEVNFPQDRKTKRKDGIQTKPGADYRYLPVVSIGFGLWLSNSTSNLSLSA